MPTEIIGGGMVARAFGSRSRDLPNAIICAAGVANSQCVDDSAFRREHELLIGLLDRARTQDAVLVYFSGAPVYGRATGPHVETAAVEPESPYGRHKLDCERLIAGSGARYLVVRLPNVVGPIGNPNQLVPSLVAQVIAGDVIVRAGATRDLIDVDDVVRIVETLIRRGDTDITLNIASGVSTPVEQLASQVAAILGISPTITRVDGGDDQEFSTALVRSLLPDFPQFDREYPLDVLKRRVPSIARAITDSAPVGSV